MLVENSYFALGKMVAPGQEEAEVNLPAARHFIDTLESLKARTQGNLSKEETSHLELHLTSLRLNYVEVEKSEKSSSEAEDETKPGEEVEKE